MDSDSFEAYIIEGICLHVFIQLILPEDARVKPGSSEHWLDFRIIKGWFFFCFLFLKDNDSQAPPPKFDLFGLGGEFLFSFGFRN